MRNSSWLFTLFGFCAIMDLDTSLFPPVFARPACLIGDNGTNKPETLSVLRKSEHKVVEQVQLNRQHEHTDQN